MSEPDEPGTPTEEPAETTPCPPREERRRRTRRSGSGGSRRSSRSSEDGGERRGSGRSSSYDGEERRRSGRISSGGGEESTGSSRRSLEGDRRHRHHRHRRQSSGMQIMLLSFLLAALTPALIVVYSLGTREAKERDAAAEALQLGARELEALRPEQKLLEQEVGRLTRARLPGLRPMETDEVLSIEEAHVANVLFTTSGNDKKLNWEYKVMVKNSGSAPARFRLDILFFNRTGIQVGRSRVAGGPTGDSPVLTLEPGESRSYSDTAEIGPTGKAPSYFMFMSRGS